MLRILLGKESTPVKVFSIFVQWYIGVLITQIFLQCNKYSIVKIKSSLIEVPYLLLWASNSKFQFLKAPEFLHLGDTVLFREGRTRGKGKIIKLYPYDEKTNPEGLGLNNWLKDYEKEAKVSTAGIRGPQNILYPTDTRFPISLIGVMLATIAKALVAKENYPNKKIVKLAGREVRYNSDKMLDLIARIQAAQGITTLVPQNRTTIPIWLASFLAFKLDLLGGEYITSSHGISVKNATKDLNSQGSQYLPEESMQFVNKIKEILQ